MREPNFDEFTRRADAVYRSALGHLLGEFRWHHFAHLAARWPSTDQLWKSGRLFIRRLENRAQRPISWFAALEGNIDAHPHLHLLLYGTAGMPIQRIHASWDGGNSRVSVFDPLKLGNLYVTKQADGLDIRRWDFSARMPPRIGTAEHLVRTRRSRAIR